MVVLAQIRNDNNVRSPSCRGSGPGEYNLKNESSPSNSGRPTHSEKVQGEGKTEKKIQFSSVQFSPLTDWVTGGRGGMWDDSAEILSQSFLQEAL